MQAPVVQRVDSNYPADSVVCFANTYPLDSVMHPLNNRGLAGRAEAGEGGKESPGDKYPRIQCSASFSDPDSFCFV